ncbi:MAG: hypothetical protein GPJ54_13415 [Candidatus Heimdallarchaeota archaeon]|nr:hypothetical protein [Candidatus Heimdallarchaeota archaeon]
MLRVYSGKFKWDGVLTSLTGSVIRRIRENSLPNGVTFLNIYFVDRGADHHFEIVYEISGYAVLDQWNLHNPQFKSQMQSFLLELGFFAEETNEKFLKSIDEIDMMDEDVFKQIMENEKEKERSK